MGEHQRVVGRGDVPGEAQDGVLAFQMQVDVALEGDGADVIHTGRDDDHAAAVGAGLVDGALDGCGVQFTVVGDGAVVQNIDRVGREYGVRNVGQDLFCHVPRQVVGVGSSRSDLAQAILVCGCCMRQAGKEQVSASEAAASPDRRRTERRVIFFMIQYSLHFVRVEGCIPSQAVRSVRWLKYSKDLTKFQRQMKNVLVF